ncbi:RNA polymerase sigma factor [Allonocardiopsis opalescens]|uniref:DNA-directed RNA polymerase specialized sigma24 family protein n=1 Tax=Allonocardiopsis opalescens TaxID=1144618 RepID=A0A2T0PXW2_9ACTN|nr:sigma-70 family RNA polymerase sigma factor [Allonocardiopsis opalescens]PRX96363.1 DNA-directed RNA polymerase specialized sigma24 family protein [Allonocardiopsis opalescens]
MDPERDTDDGGTTGGGSGLPPLDRARDRAIVAALRRNDRSALTRLCDAYAARLYDYCAILLGDQHKATEAVADTITTVWIHVDGIREPGELGRVLYAAARAECAFRLDAAADEIPEALTELLSLASPSDNQRKSSRRGGRRYAVSREQEAVQLADVHELWPADIAAVLGVRQSTVSHLIDDDQSDGAERFPPLTPPADLTPIVLNNAFGAHLADHRRALARRTGSAGDGGGGPSASTAAAASAGDGFDGEGEEPPRKRRSMAMVLVATGLVAGLLVGFTLVGNLWLNSEPQSDSPPAPAPDAGELAPLPSASPSDASPSPSPSEPSPSPSVSPSAVNSPPPAVEQPPAENPQEPEPRPTTSSQRPPDPPDDDETEDPDPTDPPDPDPSSPDPDPSPTGDPEPTASGPSPGAVSPSTTA